MKITKSYHFYASITMVLWSLAYVFTRLALQYFSPFSLGLLRYAAASCALIIVVVVSKISFPSKAAIPWIILSGATGFFLYMLTFNMGSRTVSSATSCTVISTVPIITAILARFIYKEKLTALQYISIFISFIGVVVLTLMKGGLTADTGMLYICAAAVLLSVYNLLQRKLTKTCSPLQVTSYSIFFGTIMLCIFAPGAVTEVKTAPTVQILYVLFLGVFPGAIAYCCWTKALAIADNTSSVSNYMFVEPFLAAIFGFIFAGESVDSSTIVGGLIIIAGLFLYYFGESLRRRILKAPG